MEDAIKLVKGVPVVVSFSLSLSARKENLAFLDSLCSACRREDIKSSLCYSFFFLSSFYRYKPPGSVVGALQGQHDTDYIRMLRQIIGSLVVGFFFPFSFLESNRRHIHKVSRNTIRRRLFCVMP